MRTWRRAMTWWVVVGCGSDPATSSSSADTTGASSESTATSADTSTTGSTSGVDTTTTDATSSDTSEGPSTTATGSESSTSGGPAVCGDGELGADEECDDGGRVAGDGCRADCTWEVTALALGGEHSCALRGPRVRCWGRGDAGRLGHGDTVSIGDDEPAAAGGDIELGGDAVAITAGGDHSCALLSGGDVVCWGGNAGGWLGYGNTEPVGDDETPASVGPVAVGGPALAIATGRSATCALLESTELRCWGQGPLIGAGNDADLGDDETPARIDPVMLGGVASVVDVGELHTCAGGDDGLWCWGQGVFGQLGYGNTELVGDDETPAEAGTVDLGADVVALAMGDVHSCALTDAGGVRCWGQSGFGQLGYGNGAAIGDDESPATAGDVALGGEATAIATGIVSSYALLADGTIVSWGGNDSGELGRGNTTAIGDNETPASVPPVDVGGVAVALAAGQSHACALLDDGAVRCWGAGFSGRLGHGNTDAIGDDETPADVGDVPVY